MTIAALLTMIVTKTNRQQVPAGVDPPTSNNHTKKSNNKRAYSVRGVDEISNWMHNSKSRRNIHNVIEELNRK